MREYLSELKPVSFDLQKRLRDDKDLCQRIIAYDPQLEDRLKVRKWNFVQYKFKYFFIEKMKFDYNMQDDILDLEEYYDEILYMYMLKYVDPLPPCQQNRSL